MFRSFVYVVLILHASDVLAIMHEDAVPNEYVIQLDPTIGDDEMLTGIPGAKIIRKYTIGTLDFALIITDDTFSYTNFAKHSKIKLFPNRIVTGFQDDAICYRQDSGRTYYGLSRISNVDIPVDWDDSYYLSDDTGKCVTIYVVDSGINVEHETFGKRAHIGYTVADLYEREGHGDLAGHGTHVAGLAGGSIHGTAKHANIISVKVLDSNTRGQTDWLIEGLEWIARHMNETGYHNLTSVINLSLGMYDPSGQMDWLEDVISAIPAVAVAAAGDEQDDACKYVPARFPSVITVAATNMYDRFPFYTNEGRCVDILAPGHSIISASHRDNTGESQKSGTSMAAGFVSGVVARHLQNITEQVNTTFMKALLQATASVNKTNSDVFDTINLLLYAGCASGAPVVDNISDWTTAQCFPYITTTTTEPSSGPKLTNWSIANHAPDSQAWPWWIVMTVGVCFGFVGLVIFMYRKKKSKKGSEANEKVNLFTITI